MIETVGSRTQRQRLAPGLAHYVDLALLWLVPLLGRLVGYRFQAGTDETLARDARSVHRAVWAAKGISVPADAARFGERYDRAVSTWVVAYHRGEAIGAMALLDMRVASVTLDYEGREAPDHLGLPRTREIGRLAILPAHRGRGQLVLLGVLFAMVLWCLRNDIACLFSGSTPALYEVYRRFNPTARLVTSPRLASESPLHTRYFEALRRHGGAGCMYTFNVFGCSPTAALLGSLKRRRRALARPEAPEPTGAPEQSAT